MKAINFLRIFASIFGESSFSKTKRAFSFIPILAILFIGLSCEDKTTESNDSFTPKWVRNIAVNSNDLWVTTDSGIIKYNKETGIKTLYNKNNSSLPDNDVVALVCGKDEIWISTKSQGIAKFDGKEFTLYNQANSGLENNDNNCLAFDAQGNLWVGGRSFFYKFDGNHWTHFTTPKSIISSFLSFDAIAFDNEGTLWFGGRDAILDGSFGKYSEADGVQTIKSDGHINSICIDKNDNKWLSSSRYGISKYDGSIITRFTKEKSDIPSNNTNALHIDPSGTIWFGSDAYLIRYDGVNFASIKVPVKSTMDYISSITPDGNAIWIGTRYSGLFKYSDGLFENINIDKGSITADSIPQQPISDKQAF